ncbi:MAG: sugar-binding transcriptional regulator [Gammaproteobacteria bacterium]|nr:sugar-binding transcriptional regulator [Gammaproteobacteria bacterium]
MSKHATISARTTPAQDDWPEQLAVRIAKYYYELGLTQQEIAARIGIGRARVIRLLAESRERGLVTININSPLLENIELADALAERYQLDFAEVCLASSDDENQLARQIAIAAGPTISRMLRNDMTVGLGWGVTLKELAVHLPQQSLTGVSVVSLLGSLTRRSSVTRYEATTELAAKLEAECHYLPAPIVCDSTKSREVLSAQPMFRDVYHKAMTSDIAIVSIGGLDSATIRAVKLVSDEEYQAVKEKGAIGNFLGYYIDGEGNVIEHALNDRIIGIRDEAFRVIPKRIMLSGGAAKAAAIRTVLKRGTLTGLITDNQTAKLLLDEADTRFNTTDN